MSIFLANNNWSESYNDKKALKHLIEKWSEHTHFCICQQHTIKMTKDKKIQKSGVPSLDESILGRLGRMMTGKVNRWVVIAVWIIAAIGLTITLPAVNDRTANNAADLPEDSPSVVADELIKEEFPNSSGIPALLTWHREGGLTEDRLGPNPVPFQETDR